MKANNVTTGAVVFIIFVTLFVNVYQNFEEVYAISRDGTGCQTCENNNLTIGEDLLNTSALRGIDDVKKSIEAFSVPGNILLKSFEVLTGAGLGIIKVFIGLAVLPGDIVEIILKHYLLPPDIAYYIGLILNLYILFIIVRHILKQE